MGKVEQVIGSLVGGLIDGALEAYLILHPELSGKFPYMTIGTDMLPSVDDWLVFLFGLGIYGLGEVIKNDKVADLGVGATTYSVAMISNVITKKVISFARTRGYRGYRAWLKTGSSEQPIAQPIAKVVNV